MLEIQNKGVLRIIDANFNRAKEGLRVCEDICRFLFTWKTLTENFKKVRHRLTRIATQWEMAQAIQSRDSQRDIGRKTAFEKYRRKNVQDIFNANIQRVKESLRVLEEFSKLNDQKSAKDLKRLRYKLYALEQEATKKFPKS